MLNIEKRFKIKREFYQTIRHKFLKDKETKAIKLFYFTFFKEIR